MPTESWAAPGVTPVGAEADAADTGSLPTGLREAASALIERMLAPAFEGLADAVAIASAGAAALPDAEAGLDALAQVVEHCSDGALTGLLGALGRLRRDADALLAQAAQEVAERSRPELGAGRLARRHGCRSADELVAVATGAHPSEAKRLRKVGEAAFARRDALGAGAEPPCPHVSRALLGGGLGTAAAEAIADFRGRVAPRAEPDAIDEAERMLVDTAPGLTLRQLQLITARLEAHVDPDGVAPGIELQRQRRALVFGRNSAGMATLRATLDPGTVAPIRAAIEGMVSRQLRAEQRGDGAEPAGSDEAIRMLDDGRSIPQLQADALASLCAHALGCDSQEVPGPSATVIVRLSLDDLGADVAEGSGLPLFRAAARPDPAPAPQPEFGAPSPGAPIDIGDWRRIAATALADASFAGTSLTGTSATGSSLTGAALAGTSVTGTSVTGTAREGRGGAGQRRGAPRDRAQARRGACAEQFRRSAALFPRSTGRGRSTSPRPPPRRARRPRPDRARRRRRGARPRSRSAPIQPRPAARARRTRRRLRVLRPPALDDRGPPHRLVERPRRRDRPRQRRTPLQRLPPPHP